MAKKSVTISISFLFLASLVVGSLCNLLHIKKNGFFVYTFVKNNSFETNFKKDVPYKKGDEIEFSFIIENNESSEKEINLKFDEIKNQMDITDVHVDGKKVGNLNKIRLNGNSVKQINVKGIAKKLR